MHTISMRGEEIGFRTLSNSETSLLASTFLFWDTLSSRSYAIESAGDDNDFSSIFGLEPGTMVSHERYDELGLAAQGGRTVEHGSSGYHRAFAG